MDKNNKTRGAFSRKKAANKTSRPKPRPGSSTASKKSSISGRVERSTPPPKNPQTIRVEKGGKSRQRTAASQKAAPETARTRQIQNSQRKKRRKYKRNYTVYYLMLAILLTVTGIALSLTVFFRIEKIEITGSEIYNEQQVGQFVTAKEGDNLLRYNAKQEGEALLSILSRADEVTVKKKFPNTLLVQVTDGVPATQFYCDEVYYYLSEKGRVLYSGGDPLDNVTVYLGFSGNFAVGKYLPDILNEAELTRYSEVSALIKELLPDEISLVDLSQSIDIQLCWQNRIQVDLGSLAQFEEKLNMLRETMESGEIESHERGVIDLNQANMLVFNSAADLDPEMDLASDWQK